MSCCEQGTCGSSQMVDVLGDGKLMKEILVEGTGEECPPAKSTVRVHYVGTLKEDGSQFDSSRDRDQHFEFQIGVGQVIQGWDKGVLTMKKGEKSKFTINWELAYGESGSPPKIPGKADLCFEVELFSWKEFQPEPWELEKPERFAKCKKEKDAGNDHFKNGKLEEACGCWQECLRTADLSAESMWAEELHDEVLALCKSCNLNLANVYLKLKEFEAARDCATEVLRKEGDNVKALFRRACALSALKEYDFAKVDMKTAIAKEPANKEFRDKFAEIQEAVKADKARQKALHQGMFSKTGGLYKEKEDVDEKMKKALLSEKEKAAQEAEAAQKKIEILENRKLENLPRAYFDVKHGDFEGRMVFALYNDAVPKTVKNFQVLCEGDQKSADGVELKFEGSGFHRIIRDFMMQGGDFTNGNGTGGISAYGEKFEDEDLTIDTHCKKGVLSMANAGPDTNGSQFFLCFVPTPHLDGKHVVFGEIVEGEDVLERFNNASHCPTGESDVPKTPVTIVKCGTMPAPGGNGDVEMTA